MITYDIAKIPFSKYGAYISLAHDAGNGSIIVRNVRHKWGEERAFRLFFHKDGAQVNCVVTAHPGFVLVTHGRAQARLYVHTDEGLAIDSRGFTIRLASFEGRGVFGSLVADGWYTFIAGMSIMNASLRVKRGTLHAMETAVGHGDASMGPVHHVQLRLDPADGDILAFLHVSCIEKRNTDAVLDPDRDIAAVTAEWDRFRAKMPNVAQDKAPFAERLWLLLWSCFVRAEGNFRRDACLMSKGSMTGVWSWDHCFNALALSRGDLRLGLDQFFLMFDHQSEIGHMPDFMNVANLYWSISKPPVHGLFFDRIMAAHDLDRAVLDEAYRRLVPWTEWWFEFRDSDRDGIPHYNLGVDSGWDNATVFDGLNEPLESPDLPAFLVLQMQCLGRIATALGRPDESRAWAERATALLDALIRHSWTDAGFVALTSRTHRSDPAPTSLLPLMALVLGDALPAEKRRVLIDRLTRDFLTPHGAASEAPSSARYTPDGYWRGPVWAPAVYLLVDGLRRAGETDLARSLALRFCDTVEHSGGSYENYDALTGAGLRDMGYTWTASVALVLLNDYAGTGQKP